MIDYFKEEFFLDAKSHKKRLTIHLIVAISVFVLLSAVLITLFVRTPYQSSTLTLIKWLHYCLIGIFVIYLAVFLGIPYKRVRRFYKVCRSFSNGMTREYFGEFVGVDTQLTVREGVDTYYLEFKEYNKDKGAFFIRKVSIFAEKEIPEFNVGDKVRYFTHNNFLIKYEIRESKKPDIKE